MPTFDRMDQFPKTYFCWKCMEEKPVEDMVVVRLKKQKKITQMPLPRLTILR